ncbi:BQ5605_C008g05015 [Microbotryum silenes-dioicae]|uniref:BQ5605_C008g05015 protein n=1 Tax=Microbotryum silenes-dioicae TaxID=796604 RepID=A0A2X0MYV6_9BASI|nr:BQ5605_C008g05015 [Microbotryum silenes-dioicae]
MPQMLLSEPGSSKSMGRSDTRIDHDAYHELNLHLQQQQHEHDYVNGLGHEHRHAGHDEPERVLVRQRASTSTKNRPRSPSPYRAHPEQSSTEFLKSFWQHSIDIAETVHDDFKHQALPLARIKKVMKSDPEVKAIFIQEITNRAHMVSLASRRRTLARSDVAEAVAKSDTFDFLVDVVPRDESTPLPPSASASVSAPNLGQDGAEESEAPKASTSRTTLDSFTSSLDVGAAEDAVEDPEDEAGLGEDELAEGTLGVSKTNARKRPSRATGKPRGRPKKRPATDTGPSHSEREAEHERARLVAEEQARHAAAMGHLQGKAAEASNPAPTPAPQMPPPNPTGHHSGHNSGMYGLSAQSMQAPPHLMGLPMGMGLGMGMGMPISMPMGLPTSAAGSHEEYQRWMLEQFQRSGAHNAHPFMAPGSMPWPNPFTYDSSHTFFAHTAQRE